MKASSAVTILRAARARMDMGGFTQIGTHELYALLIAREATKEHGVAVLLLTAIEAMSQVAVAIAKNQPAGGAVLPFSPSTFEAIRTAYKAIETLPPENEWKTTSESLLVTAIELKAELSLEFHPKELKPKQVGKEQEWTDFCDTLGYEPPTPDKVN